MLVFIEIYLRLTFFFLYLSIFNLRFLEAFTAKGTILISNSFRIGGNVKHLV